MKNLVTGVIKGDQSVMEYARQLADMEDETIISSVVASWLLDDIETWSSDEEEFDSFKDIQSDVFKIVSDDFRWYVAPDEKKLEWYGKVFRLSKDSFYVGRLLEGDNHIVGGFFHAVYAWWKDEEAVRKFYLGLTPVYKPARSGYQYAEALIYCLKYGLIDPPSPEQEMMFVLMYAKWYENTSASNADVLSLLQTLNPNWRCDWDNDRLQALVPFIPDAARELGRRGIALLFPYNYWGTIGWSREILDRELLPSSLEEALSWASSDDPIKIYLADICRNKFKLQETPISEITFPVDEVLNTRYGRNRASLVPTYSVVLSLLEKGEPR